MDNELEQIAQRIIEMPNQVICTFYEDDKVHCVAIDIEKDEHIKVEFDKGYVIVSTESETKFVCKGKSFISLWK